jgi:p-hydroxybenzoate 3-monooxygenase
MRTQVAVIGAGPAGLLLAHLLHKAGVATTIIERRNRPYIEGRVRAGVVESITADLMADIGVDQRLKREGLVHTGTNIVADGHMFRIGFPELTGGRSVTVYGQSEVMRDLFDAAEARQVPIVFEAEDVALHDLNTAAPHVTWRKDGVEHRLDCDYVAGCDGYHGVSRASIPADVLKVYEKVYPFGWLGILADVKPCDHELIYCNHARGFALASMRSPTRSRYYVQVSDADRVEDWSDERFWRELETRLGSDVSHRIERGPSFDKSIAPLRSFVAEPMRWGALFLAGDSAHIVPPTGAKGMNLAASDVKFLSDALIAHYRDKADDQLDGYSARALARVWKAERFSWWFTSLTHQFPGAAAIDHRLQIAELDYLRGSLAAQTVFAENYVGLPLGDPR